MNNIKVDFRDIAGKVKPMHAVNNGPVYDPDAKAQNISNLEDFQRLCIPYVRNHDASFAAEYGGEHSVDVHAVFPDFDKDPCEESSYDFQLTDEYLRSIEIGGSETFYRLGSKIEHGSKKYGTVVPEDFNKWAVICEHIIKHYNYGWNNGYHMHITYWEIWNEPDGAPNWTGTPEQYYEMYNITANHLKKMFPGIKVGGPAMSWLDDEKWLGGFFAALKAPLDFFTWHSYGYDPKFVIASAERSERILLEHGYSETENIIDEWNYVKGWAGDKFKATINTITGMKGAAFTMAYMCLCQYLPIDMLMYYDARPRCGFNGMFAPYTLEPLKGYYPFLMFNELYKLKNSVRVTNYDGTIYTAAAVNGDEAAMIVTYFDDEAEKTSKETEIEVSGFEGAKGIEAEYYLLDEQHDMEKIKGEKFKGEAFSTIISIEANTSLLIKLKK